jgi:hypothetical protein
MRIVCSNTMQQRRRTKEEIDKFYVEQTNSHRSSMELIW